MGQIILSYTLMTFFTVQYLVPRITICYNTTLILSKHTPLLTRHLIDQSVSIMLVSHKREHTLPGLVIYLHGLPLESVSTFKYLGVLLTSDLS